MSAQSRPPQPGVPAANARAAGQAGPEATPPAEASPEAPAGPPPFDRTDLLERIDNDRTLLLELITLFREGLPALVNELAAAIASQNADRVHRAGHTLKGALLNMSAQPAADLARRIDDEARRGELGRAPEHLQVLRGELARLVEALDKEAVEVAA